MRTPRLTFHLPLDRGPSSAETLDQVCLRTQDYDFDHASCLHVNPAVA
jgi:hypothetical protein